MSETLQELIDKVKPYLRQYLTDNGVDIVQKGQTDFFKCTNPDHDDNNPSSGFVKGTGDQQFHCFSCGSNGDIFTAAQHLEGKSRLGVSFVKDNLEYLLQKYDLDYSIEYTEQQLDDIKVETIYQNAYTMLTHYTKDKGNLKYSTFEHAEKRGWTPEICRKVGIATINDYSEFLTALSKLTKIPEADLKDRGIKPSLFGPELLTISIKDATGKVEGFVARYLNWKLGSDTPKYNNTAIADNPGYQKDKLLFCLDLAKRNTSQKLDIFEGYGSAIVAHQNGYTNCVAIGSTSFTDNHMALLQEMKFQHINFVLDQDSTGMDKMEKYIEKFGGYSGLQVTITNLPISDEDRKKPGQNDPDYYIRQYGIDAYRQVKSEGVFEHMLVKNKANLNLDTNPVYTKNFAKQVIPLILNQPDMIERSSMISALAEHTKIDKDDIKNEIQRLEKTDVRSLKEDLAKRIRGVNNADDLKSILAKSIDNITDTGNSKNNRYLASLGESIEVFDAIFTDMNSQPEGIHGWKTGFDAFDDMLDGIPKPTRGGTAIGFAGAPQHGKSAVLLNLAVNLAKNNDDIAICYWAIDDHRKAIAYRLVSMISGVHMKKVRNTQPRSDEEHVLIREAQDLVRELTNSRKLVFKDDRYGRSKHKAERWLKETQDATGNDILFCVDSLHNVAGESGSEARIKIVNTSTWLKSLCASMPATVMTSIELVKNKTKGEKPTLMSISESGKVEFDFDTIAVVWNQAQGNYISVDQVDAKWGTMGNYKPIIEIDFQKNKAGAGEKGSLYLRYDTDTTGVVDCLNHRTYRSLTQSSGAVQGDSGQKYGFGTAVGEETLTARIPTRGPSNAGEPNMTETKW
jgi:DNA primase